MRTRKLSEKLDDLREDLAHLRSAVEDLRAQTGGEYVELRARLRGVEDRLPAARVKQRREPGSGGSAAASPAEAQERRAMKTRARRAGRLMAAQELSAAGPADAASDPDVPPGNLSSGDPGRSPSE